MFVFDLIFFIYFTSKLSISYIDTIIGLKIALLPLLTFKAYEKLMKYFLNMVKKTLYFFLYTKMTNNYYQKHKEKFEKEARERC